MTNMKLRHAAGAFAAATLLALAGCSSSNDPGSPPSGCSSDSSVQCAQGVGWSCAAGDNPEAEQSGLSCSDPTADGSNDDFCCFEWTYGSSCSPDDGVTATCQPGSYGYSCAAGDDPSSYDSSLNCSSPTAEGSNDDFCCTD
jgi:hypothetical protein